MALLPRPGEDAATTRTDSDGVDKETTLHKNEFREDEDWTPDSLDKRAVRRLVWKLDLVFVPLTFAIYTFCFIDRSSIGNAGIAGFKPDNGLVGAQYNLGVSVFFIFYCAFQAPSNLVLKRVGARLWVTFLILSFGLITIGTAFSRSFGSFVAVRALLGMVEGGVLSGLALMLTLFYTREELTLRIAAYMLCPSFSGAFGGLLAYGLIQLGPRGDALKSWSWIFLIEGSISVFLAFVCILCMPSSYEKAWFLNAEEKALGRRRMNISNRVHDSLTLEKTTVKLVLHALSDPFNLLVGFIYIAASYCVQSLAIFTPTILNGLGYSVLDSQLYSVWPNLLGWFTNVGILFLSNYLNMRGPLILICNVIAAAGFGMLLAPNFHVNYGGLFVANLTVVAPGPLLVGWAGCNNNLVTERAIAIAMATSIGHLGAIASSWAYRTQDAPRFLLGNGLNLGFCVYAALLTGVTLLYIVRENRARDRGARDHRLTGDALVDEKLGSQHPRYRYLL